jgi:hypothetical protein
MPFKQFEIRNLKFEFKYKCFNFKFLNFSNSLQILNFKFQIPSSFSSERGVAQLALVILLLAGVAIGTYVVQNRTNVSPNAAEPEETSGCKKVSMSGRSEQELADGRLEVTFTWGDGRTTYDYKTPKKADGDRTLIGAQSRGTLADGTAINKSGASKTSGNTVTQGWSDGSVQYNIVSSGTNHQGLAGERIDASYMMVPSSKGGSCDSSKTATTPKKTSTPKTGSATKTESAPQTNSAAKTNTSNTTTAPITQTQPTSATNTSGIDPQVVSDRLTALYEVFNKQVAQNEATKTATMTAIERSNLQKYVERTRQTIWDGWNAENACSSALTTACASQLPPFLTLATTLARYSSYLAITYNVPEICVRADFGLNPPINLTSQDSVTGPLYLCSGSVGTDRKWRIFDELNVPHTLTATDAAIWKPNINPADYPQQFKDKIQTIESSINK